MAAKYAGDVCVISGKYQKDGQEKNRYMKVGAYFQDPKDGRIGVLLQAIPINMNVGKDGGTWLSLFAKQEDNNNTPRQPQQQNNNSQGYNNNNGDDEAVPF